jgi:hypothetical protein
MSWFDIIKKEIKTSYVVRNEIWDEAGGEGMDTIPQLEEKLGRKLTLEDFSPAPANWSNYANIIPKVPEDLKNILIDRIGGEEGKKELARQYLEQPVWSEESMHPGKTIEYMKEAEELLGENNG